MDPQIGQGMYGKPDKLDLGVETMGREGEVGVRSIGGLPPPRAGGAWEPRASDSALRPDAPSIIPHLDL